MTNYKVIKKESFINPGHTIYACYKNNKQIDTYYVPWEADAWLERMNLST